MALGKKNDYAYYKKRSGQWINVFDPGSQFMRARKNGTLYEPFSPYTVDNNYTEANSWQYSFYVPHDVAALTAAHGGVEAISNNLDQLFLASTKTGLFGQYAQGIEPSHLFVYLYEQLNKQTTMASKINLIRSEFYKNEPDGLIGNEDCGQMSAWYVMSALGMYPLCPGDGQYIVTEPLFGHVVLNGYNHLKQESGGSNNDGNHYTINKKAENVLISSPNLHLKSTS
jgi:putative alpha-1,2-mannosidase